jgi:hypothetical protein
MSPRSWAQLETNNFNPGGSNILVPAIGGSLSYITQYSDRGVWDPVSHEFFFYGAAHGDSAQNQLCRKFVKYSESDNSWSVLPDPGFWTAHAYEHQTIDPSTGLLYYRSYNSTEVRAYNTRTNVWNLLPNIPMGPHQVAGALEYFPDRHGLVFVDGDWGVWFYNLSTHWTQVAHTNGGGSQGLPVLRMGPYHNFSAYSPIYKLVLFGGGNGSSNVYKMDAKGHISTAKSPSFAIGVTATIVSIDPVSGKYLVITSAKQSYEYDPGTDAWTQLDIPPAPFFGIGPDGPVFGAVAAPISNYGIVIFVKYAHDGKSSVFLYKHSPS